MPLTRAEVNRRYRERHPGRHAEQNRLYRERHPGAGAAQAAAYRERHPDRGIFLTPEHRAWAHAKQRVTNPDNKDWDNYGGRGIRMAPEWLNDFAAFLTHVGLRPSEKHSLDRIDVNGDYAPGNVRWATASEQRRNRRDSR